MPRLVGLLAAIRSSALAFSVATIACAPPSMQPPVSISTTESRATIVEYATPEPGSDLGGIVRGPDGAMWYTAGGLHHPLRIGRITSSGQLREFVVRDQSQSANMIAAGADGALWITQTGAGRTTIARVTVDGAVTEFMTPGNPPDHLPRNLVGIVLGTDGRLWF